jgi:hypothetical protein
MERRVREAADDFLLLHLHVALRPDPGAGRERENTALRDGFPTSTD